MPERIQRRRTRGWTMPAGAVYVGRPTKWGNPFRVSDGRCGHPDCGADAHPETTPAMAVAAFGRWATDDYRAAVIRELRGKDLACWCPIDSACHADLLLEIANA